MGEAHVVSALRDKRAELSGLILELEKELHQRRADLAHLDATLKLFAPDLSPRSIKPRRPGRRNAWFRRGECTRAVLDMLAKHPMTSVEITDKLMAMRGIDASDAKARTGLRRTVLNLLKAGGTNAELVLILGIDRFLERARSQLIGNHLGKRHEPRAAHQLPCQCPSPSVPTHLVQHIRTKNEHQSTMKHAEALRRITKHREA